MGEQQSIQMLQTMLRVIASYSGEIPTIIPDGIYGPETMAAVQAFQRAVGLPATGKVDEQTWRDITTAYEQITPLVQEPAPLRILLQRNAVLKYGSKNSHIHIIQAMLLALSRYYENVPSVGVTGVYDRPTEQAITCLQQLSALPVTGNVDLTTWNRLVALYRLTFGTGEI